ncbi:MAG: alanine racemase, partial [Candidatus Firestonebacteria bacterium]|nr:alanine racemase [Candidatus Firestonebacteria bacterium]
MEQDKINRNYNSWVEINLDNAAYNIKNIRQKLRADVKIMAIVKANGYGHGAYEISRVLIENGADFLGVASVYEGYKLRKSGIKNRIFITNALLPDQVEEIIKLDLTPFIYTKDFAESLDKAARRAGKIVPVHIKIDTGMGRLGIAPEYFLDFITSLEKMKNLKKEGVLTHFAAS